jgi:hypothetical protein
MAVNAPEWLTKHGGELRASADGHSWMVYFAGKLQYVIVPTPAGGKHACKVTQTINGKRLDSGATYPSVEDAARGGLEDLRKAMGW